jgi:hypothetical protein
MEKHQFEVFIVTAEPIDKVLTVGCELQKSAADFFSANVLSGAPDIGARTAIGDAVRVYHYPDESVFHLRSRIPELAGECEWVVILEDHNLIDDSWIENIRSAMDRCGPDVSILVGTATNERSTDAWSWANFISVLGFHWAPMIQTPLEPLGFNVAIRRSLLGNGRLAVGQYESEIVPAAMKAAHADPGFPVDHMQFRRFPEVIYYHWCNGRATGAGMRDFSKRGSSLVRDHARDTTFVRQKRLRAVLRNHPLRDQLPRGTRLRMQLLALAHSLGALYGGRFGAGRSWFALE